MRKLSIVLGPVLVIAAAIAVIAVLGALRPSPETVSDPQTGLAVFVAPAERRDVTLSVRTQGEVRPVREIELRPEVGGRIVSVSPSFIDGGVFAAGDVLLQIEPADYRLAVIRARANVADARQALDREEAEARLAREEWDAVGVGEPTALALRQPQLDQALARLEASNASLQEAELALERTSIRAPFSGRVRAKTADLGQIVSPGQSLAQIFDTEAVEIRLPLTDDQLGQTGLPVAFFSSGAGEGAEVRFDAVVAGQVRRWTGRVTRTDAALDPQTRMLHAIAQVRDPYGAGADDDAPMAVGLFVNAEIEGRRIPDAVIVPRLALRNLNQIFVALPDDTLDIRTVELVSAGPQTAILRGGAEPGERVVVSAILSAVQGMPISPLPADGAVSPASQSPASPGEGVAAAPSGGDPS